MNNKHVLACKCVESKKKLEITEPKCIESINQKFLDNWEIHYDPLISCFKTLQQTSIFH